MQKDIEFKNRIIISIWECLSEIFLWKKYNWNTFQFINIEFENDIWLGAYEFIFVLFCCGIRIRIPHETKKSIKNWKILNKRLNETKKKYQFEGDKNAKGQTKKK